VIVTKRAMLAEIYGWFTEGFDTADLERRQGAGRRVERITAPVFHRLRVASLAGTIGVMARRRGSSRMRCRADPPHRRAVSAEIDPCPY